MQTAFSTDMLRLWGGDVEAKAKEDNSLADVPIEAFRIEYYGQGQLAKVAEDPLEEPAAIPRVPRPSHQFTGSYRNRKFPLSQAFVRTPHA